MEPGSKMAAAGAPAGPPDSFGRRIIRVVAVVLALALAAVAVVAARLIESSIGQSAEARFEEVRRSALPKFLADQAAQVLTIAQDEAISSAPVLEATVRSARTAARDSLPEWHDRIQSLADINASLSWYPVLSADLFAAIASDGRVVWNRADPDDAGGPDWSAYEIVRHALQGRLGTVVAGPGDPAIPPIFGEAATGLFVVGAVPLKDQENGGPGAFLIGNRLHGDDLQVLSAATGMEVLFQTRTSILTRPDFLTEFPGAPEIVRRLGDAGEVSIDRRPFRYRRMKIGLPQGVAGVDTVLLRPLARDRAVKRRLWLGLVAVGGLALVGGLAIAHGVSAPMREAVRRLVEGTDALRDRNFRHRVEVGTRDELAAVGEALNRMAGELEKGERIERTMKLSVPRKYFDYILAHPEELGLQGATRTVTCLFCDLAGFTRFSEGEDPQRVVRRLNEYFATCAKVIEKHDGMIDKFIGDAVMALWNAPVAVDGHAARALAAAIEMADATRELARGWEAKGALLASRIGVHTGEAVTGHVGGSEQKSYTAVGDTINLASRLEGANKIYGSRILTTGSSLRLAGEAVVARFVDRVRVKGREAPVEIHEVLGPRGGHLPPRAAEPEYRAAWDAYAAGRFDDAAGAFRRLLDRFPDDGPVAAMHARCLQYARAAPDGFDGVHAIDVK